MKSPKSQLTFKIPFHLRDLRPIVKSRGGRYNPDEETWSLEDSDSNRALVNELSSPPRHAVSTEERVGHVAQTAASLLNGLKIGHFVLIEATPSRVVIEAISET